MFVEKIQKTFTSQIFSTDFDYWVTKVNNGTIIQKGRHTDFLKKRNFGL